MTKIDALHNLHATLGHMPYSRIERMLLKSLYKGGRMAEWLRPADCEVLTIKLRGINYLFVHLVFEKTSI